MKIAVAGTGYVGLSIATLLAQHHQVVAVDVIPEKVDMLNRKQSPIQDEYIEKYLAEKPLDLIATLDGATAYQDAEFVVIAAPTNYDPVKNYFPLPNEIYQLGLSHGAIAVYGYLLRIEDRRTYQCHPSYRTIGKAVQLSENTVRKYVAGLEEKGLIRTEPSTITTKDGRVRNGSLIYTIRPIQEALELNYQRQFLQAERDVERAKAEKRLAELNQQNKKEESA